MHCYQVKQSFYNSNLGVEGKLGEFLEMSVEDAGIIGDRYLKGVSRDALQALKNRRIKPRIVSINQRAKQRLRAVPEAKQVTAASDKMIKPRRRRTKNK